MSEQTDQLQARPTIINQVTYSETRRQYLKAMRLAQIDFHTVAMGEPSTPLIPKNKTAKVRGTTGKGRDYNYEFRYADIADVLSAVMPILTNHGFVVEQVPLWLPDGKGIAMWLATRITHIDSDEWAESLYLVASNAVLSAESHLKVSGFLTAARRYALAPMLGVAAEQSTESTEGFDDDGFVPDRTPEPPARSGPPRSTPPRAQPATTAAPAEPVPGTASGKVTDFGAWLRWVDEHGMKSVTLDQWNDFWTQRVEPMKSELTNQQWDKLSGVYAHHKKDLE